jgi:hypothetical protein
LARNNTALRERLTSTLQDPAALPPKWFDHAALARLMEEHYSNRRQEREILFALLTFGLWHKKFVCCE